MTPYFNTTIEKLNLIPSETFLDLYKIALYHHEFNNFQNIQGNKSFTLSFNQDKARIHTFQPSVLHQDNFHVFDQFQ